MPTATHAAPASPYSTNETVRRILTDPDAYFEESRKRATEQVLKERALGRHLRHRLASAIRHLLPV